MAYVGYHSSIRARPNRVRGGARFRLAWERLALFGASALAWFGIFAAARAIFW